MIYFIVTSSIFNDCPIRKRLYITAINTLKKIIYELNIDNSNIIIVENNGQRDTFLNTLGCEVFYTSNNFIQTNNKGIKELQDVLDCIEKYSIAPTDFIVKMTGRYILNEDSEFMKIVKDIHKTTYECVIRYGSFNKPVNYKMDDCITGLIGMSCLYVKQIEKPAENEAVEWKWAKATRLINDKHIYMADKLGIEIYDYPRPFVV